MNIEFGKKKSNKMFLFVGAIQTGEAFLVNFLRYVCAAAPNS